MSKEVFNIDFRKGSFIEKYSKSVGTNVGNKITKQEKGLTYASRQVNAGQLIYDATDTTALNFGTNPFSMVCAVRIRGYIPIGSSYNMVFGKGQLSSTGSILLGYLNNNMLDYEWQDGSGGFQNITFDDYGNANDGKFHLVILTFDGTTYKAYIDNTQESTTSTIVKNLDTTENFYIGSDKINSRRSNSDILYIRAYEGALTTQERNELYKELLRSSPTEKAIKGFEYPKPTDLSNEEGLVAAYNMIPTNGELVDISGNGNNGIINGVLSTKDGMRSKTVNENVYFTTPILNNASIWSIKLRFKNYSINGNNDFIIGGNSYKNIGFGGAARNYVFFREDSGVYNYWDGNNNTTAVSDDSIEELEHDMLMTSDGMNIYLYLDGVYKGYITPSSTYLYIISIFDGYLSGSNQGSIVEILDFKAYDYILNSQQAQDYHNSFIKPVILEDFSNNAVGDTL